MIHDEQEVFERIDRRALEHVFRQIPTTWLGAMLTGGLFVAGLWQSADHEHLLWWFAAHAVSLAYRYYVTVNYFQVSTRERPPAYWGGVLLRMGVVQGIVWGMAPLLFLNTESISNQVLILCIVVALPVTSLPITGYWINLFFSFAIVSNSLLAIRLFMEQDVEYLVLGVSVIVYILVIVLSGWAVGRSLREGIRLGFENQDLIDELSMANQTKSRFLAAASHDLRQPVHSLALFNEALAPEVKTQRGRALLDSINVTLMAHNSLLDSLLDISKLDAGVIEPKVAKFPIKPLLENLYREMRPKAEEKELHFYVRACVHWALSDATLLMNIIRNLVGNAINYTDQGWVMVSCRRRGDNLLLQVWDSGCGIPESQLEAIFKEFHQLRNPERDRSKGLGLGLAICRRVADMLGHQLKVISRPGRGSVFSLTLPRVQQEEVSEQLPAQLSRWDFSGRTLLVIDDELSVRQGMAALLERWGCDVLLADGVDSAVQVFEEAQQGVDAIISDYRLRDSTTGVEAIRAIHARAEAPLPAMLITGDTDPRRLQEAKESGYALLHKPVKPAQMRSVLGLLLQQEK